VICDLAMSSTANRRGGTAPAPLSCFGFLSRPAGRCPVRSWQGEAGVAESELFVFGCKALAGW